MNNRNRDSAEALPDGEPISKTQLKNEAKAELSFAKQLIQLNLEKLSLLPLSDTTKDAVRDYEKQSGNIARKRHLAFIGKCLRNEDTEAAKRILVENDFSSLRKRNQTNMLQEECLLIAQLIEKGDVKIQALLEKNQHLDRQLLRQLVRNMNNAKSEKKKIAGKVKLAAFLKDNQIHD